MRFAALLVLSAASIAIASPAAHLKKRATCRGGQTVDYSQASDIELRIIGSSSDQIFSIQCCVWYDVLRDLPSKLWEHRECDDGVHSALRLTFHDAIGFSNSLTASGSFGGGGADGSIIEHADVEFEFRANRGLREIVEKERRIALAHNVSFADMIQFAGAAGITNCPGAPRLEFLAGRPFTSRPSPPGLVPNPADNVDIILGRMADAGFTAEETVDLLASHSIADQHKLNPTIEGSPFDTTPTRFDSQFFVETLLKGVLYPGHVIGEAEVRSPLPGEFRMQSDFAIARDPRYILIFLPARNIQLTTVLVLLAAGKL
ncbi:hypothetical protein NMY22_g6354 [Coprinellus aureogranulatus]|nr:hypothetical protein NMY22_g6354 [Coprinellus aureogranulatus]